MSHAFLQNPTIFYFFRKLTLILRQRCTYPGVFIAWRLSVDILSEAPNLSANYVSTFCNIPEDYFTYLIAAWRCSFDSLRGLPLRGLSNKPHSPLTSQACSQIDTVCRKTPNIFANALRLKPSLNNKIACARILDLWTRWCFTNSLSVNISATESSVIRSVENYFLVEIGVF